MIFFTHLILALALSSAFSLPALGADTYETLPPIIRNEHRIQVSRDGVFSPSSHINITRAVIEPYRILLELELETHGFLTPFNVDAITLNLGHQWQGSDVVPDNQPLHLSDLEWTATLSKRGNLKLEIPLDAPLNLDTLALINVSNWDIDWSDDLDLLDLLPTPPSLRQANVSTVTELVHHLGLSASEQAHLLPHLQPLGITLQNNDLTLQLMSTLATTHPQAEGANALTFVSLKGMPLGLEKGAKDIALTFAEQGQGDWHHEIRALYFDEEEETAYFAVHSWVSEPAHDRTHLPVALDFLMANHTTPIDLSVSFHSPVVIEGAFTPEAHTIYVAGHPFDIRAVSLDPFSIHFEVMEAHGLAHHLQALGMDAQTIPAELFTVVLIYDNGSQEEFFIDSGHFALSDDLPSYLHLWSWPQSDVTGVSQLILNGTPIIF